MLDGRKITPKIVGRQASYSSINYPGDRHQAEASARKFLQEYLGELKIKTAKEDLSLRHVQHGLTGSGVFLEPRFKGKKVYGASVSIQLTGDGLVDKMHAVHYANLKVAPGHEGAPALDQKAAEGFAKQAI